jgi:hypothetical protein
MNAVTVAPITGNITVVGNALDYDALGNQYYGIWISTFDPSLNPVGTFNLSIGEANGNGVTSGLDVLRGTRAVAADQQGNIVVAGLYVGNASFPTPPTLPPQPTVASFTSPFYSAGCGAACVHDTYVAKVSPQGTVLWATSMGALAVQPGFGNPGPISLDFDSAGNVLVVIADTSGNGQSSAIWKLAAADGSVLLPSPILSGLNAVYSAARFDANDNVYATGFFASGQDFGQGPITINGLLPFLVKYDSNNNTQWVKYPNLVCPQNDPNCGAGAAAGIAFTEHLANGQNIAFDPSGNILLGIFGNPAIGGGLDFGVGTFPTYSTGNIFLAAYSPAGQFVWAKQVPTILGSNMLGLAMGTQGRIVVSGNYSGSMQVDDALLVTPASQVIDMIDSFVASFDEPSPSPPTIGTRTDWTGAAFTTVPQSIVVPATSPAGACIFFNPPTSIDNGSGVNAGPGQAGGPPGTTVTCNPRPNTVFPIGTTTVTCTASDPFGNTLDPSGNPASVQFSVTVLATPDPAVAQVPPMTVEANVLGGAYVTYTPPTVIDVLNNPPSCSSCGTLPPASGTPPPPPAACAPPPVPAACQPLSGSLFGVGTTTVTCTGAVDSLGRTPTGSFVVNVVDHLPPTVNVPPDVTAEATGPNGAAVMYPAATATDPVYGSAPVTCSPASGSTFPLGTNTVTCTATDPAGNFASNIFHVTVVDTTPPKLTLPGTITATATSANGAQVTYTATALDLVDGAVTPVCNLPSGSTFSLGTSTVNCTATDAHHNAAYGSFQIVVQYAWSGYLPPINTDGSSIFRLGRTVPVKFQLTGASAGVANAVATLTLVKISSAVTGTVLEATSTSAATTGNAFRYDPTSGQYIFNLDTSPLSTGPWQLSTDLGDGVSRTVIISLR